jgi:hypothetical protein
LTGILNVSNTRGPMVLKNFIFRVSSWGVRRVSKSRTNSNSF